MNGLRLGLVLASALIASLLTTGTALAQEADQVTGVAAEQADGFATLSWEPVRARPTTRSSGPPSARTTCRPGRR